jgi:hypothetical protein
MKHLRILFALLTLCALTACSKYPEGPGISFRKAASRVANTWRIESYSINGVDKVKLPEYSTQKQFWAEDGNYSHTYIDPNTGVANLVGGTWELFNDNKSIKLTTVDANNGQLTTTTLFTILKLMDNTMWLRSNDNSIEMRLITAD